MSIGYAVLAKLHCLPQQLYPQDYTLKIANTITHPILH